MPNNGKNLLTDSFRERLLLMLAGIGLYLLLLYLPEFSSFCHRIFSSLLPFLAGLAIAYFLDIPVTFLEKRGLRSRGVALLVSLVLVGLILGLFVTQLAPGIWANIQRLTRNLPSYYRQIILVMNEVERLTGAVPDSLLDSLQEQSRNISNTSRLLSGVLAQIPGHLQELWKYSVAIGSGLLRTITATMSAVYMVMDKERLLSQASKACWALLGRRQAHWMFRVCQVANRMCKAFFAGKCIDSLVLSILTLAMLTLLKIPYGGLIALIVGVTNIVPIAGPITGGALSVGLLLLENPVQAALLLVILVVLRQLDGKYIGPRILGDRIGLSTLWVLVALMVGGAVAGVLGMLLGVPLLATGIAIGGEVMTQNRNQRHASRIAVRILEEDGE